MPFLRQSTIQSIRFGPFLDATNGVDEEVALTITQALRRISKDGGDFAQSGETGNSVHDENGWYFDNLTAADTNTVGELIFYVQDPATHLPVWMRWWVLEEAVYDAIYGAAATGPLQPTVAGRTLDVATTGEAGVDLGNVTGVLGQANVGWVDSNSRVDVGQFLGNAVVISTGLPDMNVASFDNIAAPAAWSGAVSTAVWSETIRILTAATNITSTGGTTFTQTGDSFLRIGAAGASLTDLGGMSTGMKVEINTEVLDVENVDTIAEPSAGVPPVTPTSRQFKAWMWAQWRNDGEVSSSERRVLSSTDVVLAKAPMTDSGSLFSPGEMIAP